MVPTEFGARLIEPLRNALRVIDFIRIQQPTFDARTSVRTYRIGCPDYLNVLFVPKLVALFRERAPNAQLVFHPLGDGFDDERALADGELDVVIDNRPARRSRFRQDDLFDDRVVCLMRSTHPLARRGAMTAAGFAAAHRRHAAALRARRACARARRPDPHHHLPARAALREAAAARRGRAAGGTAGHRVPDDVERIGIVCGRCAVAARADRGSDARMARRRRDAAGRRRDRRFGDRGGYRENRTERRRLLGADPSPAPHTGRAWSRVPPGARRASGTHPSPRDETALTGAGVTRRSPSAARACNDSLLNACTRGWSVRFPIRTQVRLVLFTRPVPNRQNAFSKHRRDRTASLIHPAAILSRTPP
ncbi:hypothetical protein LGM42_03700 [Burkholderia sp. AU39826]|nr:hypothetical protein [Burkholderia sp. AU39826]